MNAFGPDLEATYHQCHHHLSSRTNQQHCTEFVHPRMPGASWARTRWRRFVLWSHRRPTWCWSQLLGEVEGSGTVADKRVQIGGIAIDIFTNLKQLSFGNALWTCITFPSSRCIIWGTSPGSILMPVGEERLTFSPTPSTPSTTPSHSTKQYKCA